MSVARERIHFDRYSIVVANPGYQLIRNYPIKEDSVNRIEVVLAARQSDGIHRAVFKRIGLFYRIGTGPVLIQGTRWQTTETFKSDNNLDVQYILGPSSLSIQVQNAASGTISTHWSGYTDKLEVK